MDGMCHRYARISYICFADMQCCVNKTPVFRINIPEQNKAIMQTKQIMQKLRELLLEHVPPLKVRQDDENGFEVAGTKAVMQGKKKVDGFYFASLVPKPKDVRFYFFPVYTDPGQFNVSEKLQKMLKGKSCFHIKTLDEDLVFEIRGMIIRGVETYLAKDLI